MTTPRSAPHPSRLSRNRLRGWKKIAAVASASLVLLCSGVASAATGDLDPTFSNDGLQTTQNGAAYATASAVQADGKLVVAGVGSFDDGSPSLRGVYVARYDRAGNLDAAFGTGGISKVNIARGTEIVSDLVIDSAGRVVVLGYAAAPDYPDETDVFVLRLTPAGQTDTTFGGGDAIATIDRTNHDRAGGLAVTGSRVLVAAGFDSGGSWYNQWTVVALTTAGEPDTTFSGDGLAPVPTTTISSTGLRDLAVVSGGKLVLGGFLGGDFVTVRLTAAGDVDMGWDGDGVARATAGSFVGAYKLLVQPDGKVVLAGYADSDFAAVRWTGTGKLDTSFDGDGKVKLDFGAQKDEKAYGAALAADGKIVLGGYSYAAGAMDMAVARLNWNGKPDTSFSADGLAVTSTGATSNEQIESVTVGPSDRVVGAGWNLGSWSLVGYTGGANVTIAVSDATVTEPDEATATATFSVTLSAASPSPVTVRYVTAKGTAVPPGDYTTTSGTLTFAAGQTTKTIEVPVVGDTIAEANETFKVNLSLPTNAGIADGLAVGTIRNDD